MRIAAIALIGTLGLAGAAVSVNAAPLAPPPADPQASNIIEVAGGCRRGFHPNRWGHCVPHRYSHYRPYRYGYPRYGYYSRWHSPSDFVANQLNAQELARSGGGYYRRGHGWGY
jgi:hypothetical protein